MKIKKQDAERSLAEEIAAWLQNYDPELSREMVALETESAVRNLNLGSVAVFTPELLSKSFVAATERYARVHGPAGWGTLQQREKPEPPRVEKSSEQKDHELRMRVDRACHWY